ncbi:hypothetical protein M378DRAFT_171453 [Amanita muscaria Koide BX008]|uniref:Uncharacterized protein n=1 Tax=Amanita muscaria (strain Koide BX008) TaxID=946122 RepID=A0A0C2S4Q8_AMAMK|nr:hypothetical protein M378DRAFT_171453 [Amanita muscaria Koide BX008]
MAQRQRPGQIPVYVSCKQHSRHRVTMNKSAIRPYTGPVLQLRSSSPQSNGGPPR